MMGILALLILLGLVLAFVGGGAALVIWLVRRSRRGGEPVCGHCGYNVRGLTTFTCPECGSDLRDVGIITAPAAGSGAGPAMAAWVAVCLLLLLMGLVGGWFLQGRASTVIQGREVVQAVLLFCFVWLALLVGGIVAIVLSTRRPRPRPTRTVASAPVPAAPSSPVPAPVGSTQPATTVTRNLSIMFIDMHGYTTRTARESRDGLIDVVRHTRELVQPLLQRRRGRIVKTMGDAFLVVFDSPTEATLCGREVQAAMARHNLGEPEERRIDLRVGVSTGEVALEQQDVYGGPVNAASRLQQQARPGEVLFDEGTYHAMTRTEVPHEPAGEFELKGMPGKVKVFRVMAG